MTLQLKSVGDITINYFWWHYDWKVSVTLWLINNYLCPNKYCSGKYWNYKQGQWAPSNFNSQYWQIYIVKTNIVKTNIKTMSKNTWRSSTARTSLRPDVSGLKSTFTSFLSLETELDFEKSQEWVLRIQLKTKFCIFNWKK